MSVTTLRFEQSNKLSNLFEALKLVLDTIRHKYHLFESVVQRRRGDTNYVRFSYIAHNSSCIQCLPNAGCAKPAGKDGTKAEFTVAVGAPPAATMSR